MRSKWKMARIVLPAMVISSIFAVIKADETEISDENCPSSKGYRCLSGKCIPKNYLCNHHADCPDRDDETRCDMKLCSGAEYFQCRDGTKCISKSLICDNVADCPDNSDESDTMCLGEHIERETLKPCDLNKTFECETKICIPKKLVCDGTKHCFDGRDEDPKMCAEAMNATCPGFLCANQQCLTRHEWVCDGRKDCSDGSDELHCSPHCELVDGSFLCNSHDECVPIEKVCDGKPDCFDKSDEGGSCNRTDSCDSMKCAGACHVLPTGATCVCGKGLSYNKATNKCEDANECDRYGVCSQGCVNTNGKYYCTCAPTFRLKGDNKTCMAFGTEPVLVYTTQKKVKTIDLLTGFAQDLQKTRQAIGVTYDGQNFYWTEMSEGKEAIVKYTPGKKEKEFILTAGLEAPEDLAVDWLTGNIYFTDAHRAHVAVCTANAHHCTSIVNFDRMEKPRSLALHPQDALLFWSDWGSQAHIGVSFMDGSSPKVLIDDVHWPNGLALDWPNARIYWVDARSQTIESAFITGNGRRKVLDGFVMHPFALAVFENRLYWSDWETKTIESCDKFTGKDHDVLVQGEQIFDVHIYHEAMMPHQKHACMENECSHICLLSHNSTYSCACPENMELLPNKHTCHQVEKMFNIILGIGKHVISIPYQTFGRHQNAFIDEVDQPIDRMEFNSINGDVFLAQNNPGKIVTVDMKARKMFDLVKSYVSNVKSMAYDYLANNLYWIDNDKATLEVFSLNQKKRAIVQHYSGTDMPIAIALIPSRGEMFVALQSSDHIHIDRQSMAGGQKHFHVIETDLSKKGPIHFAVDEAKELIYWSDGGSNRIEFSNFEGMKRKTFAFSKKAPGPMAIIGGDLFWTSAKSKTLQWMDLNMTRSAKQVAMERPPAEKKMPDIVNIASGSPLRVSNHPCMTRNGGCSDICLSDGPNLRVCLCQMGNVFRDTTNTTCVKNSNCGFRCSSGECLESSQRCDNKSDCLDQSDEKACDDKFQCDSSEFMCRNGLQCIPKGQRCDQHFNCKDNSDEDNCTATERSTEHCKDHQIQCPKSKICLDVTQRCDGKDDCGDGFDEMPELCMTCPKDFFKCASGQCIPEEFKCNFHMDCVDGSDENEDCPKSHCDSPLRPCSDGWCINEKLFCDGHEDCRDGYDEMRCTPKSEDAVNDCDIGEFQCPSDPNKCVGMKSICDNYPDCPRGEDEKNCTTCPSHMFECDNDICLIKNWVCDSHDDCGDGSDEKNCLTEGAKARSKSCSANQFACSDGKCLEFDQLCDDKKDCSAGDDEGGMCSTACKDDICQQKCQKSPKGSVCSCEDGFQLGSAGDKTCVDIDECRTQNPCSQMCFNTIGSFRCSCYDGFILSSDKTTCSAMGASRMFLYKFFDQIRNFTEAPRITDVLVNLNSFRITDFDVDLSRNKIIFSIAGDDELIEVDMETQSQRVLADIPSSNRIAHDWITGNTYIVHYPDDMQVEIHVCNIEKNACGLISKLNYHEQVPSIQVDPINKLLFYVRLDSIPFLRPKSKIIKARLDGSDAQEILNDTHITALAIDADQQKVYFLEILSQSLQVVDYSGENKKYFAKDTRLIKRPISLSLFQNHAYILNQLASAITKCKLYGDMECHQVEIMENNAQRINIMQISKQKMVPDGCSDNKCDTICIPADLGYKCLCSNGTFVKPGVNCVNIDEIRADDEDESSGGLWLWIFLLFLLMTLIAGTYYLLRRRSFRGNFNVHLMSMHFRNNENSKMMPQDMKPTPFPRSTAINLPAATAPGINTLNKNCHELINDESNYYRSAASLNMSPTEVDGFSDDDHDELDNVDFSSDPHQRLIL